MKHLYITFILFVFNYSTFAQKSSLDTWTIGTGVSNFRMFGDLTSNKPNLGYYIYVNKMVSPAFGFELKGQMLNMTGSSQDLSSSYPVLHTSTNTANLKFEGDTFGGEFNLVINLNGLGFSNLTKNRKLNFATYFGLGYHSYNTKLLNETTNELILDYSSQGGNAKSIYYTSGLGLKYKLSNRLDLELRQSINFNNEDHLDATISNKQYLETFFTTQFGLVVKLHKKGSENIFWQNIFEEEVIVPKTSNIVIIDTDGDGVIDQFDKEPNTDKNALVYADGVTIDSDKDGIPDHLDKCPLEYSLTNNGCVGVANPTVKVVEPINKVDKPIAKVVEPTQSTTNEVNEPVIETIHKVDKPITKAVKPTKNVEVLTEKTDVKTIAEIKRVKKLAEAEERKKQLKNVVKQNTNSIAYKKEKAVIETIITNARNKKKQEIATKIAKNASKEEVFKENPNYTKIKELNKNSIKHNIPEIDNAVNHLDIGKTPVFPGCEDQESKEKKKTCLIAKITIHSLKNFNTDQFASLNLKKGINTIRVVFVVDKQGKSKVFRIIGKWDSKVKQEARRVIKSLPTIQPGVLNNNPTAVKFSIKLPFKVN